MIDDQIDPQEMAIQMVNKMELVTKLHESLLENVDQVQQKQKGTYATRKGHIMFHSFGEEEVWMKMRKPNEKKYLLASWEGLYLFVGYKEGHGHQEQDYGSRVCILNDKAGQVWERVRCDLQKYQHAL